MKDDEGRRVARREGRDGLEHAVLGTRRLRGVAGEEVVARLRRRELAHGREHAERVAGEHDDVARLAVDGARDLRVRDELDRVRAARVLRDAHVVVVGHARRRVVHDVLEDAAELDRVEDLGLLLRGEVDALGVAAALDVEDARVGPDVLVVADERAVGVGGERGLAGPRQAEEERHVALLVADVCGGVQRELAELDRLQVVHNGEDTLLHLASVFRTEDDHLHALEVDLHGRCRRHALREAVGRELASIVDDKVRLAKVSQLFWRRPDEHVVLLWC